MWTPSERWWRALGIAGLAFALVAALASLHEPRQPPAGARVAAVAVAAPDHECPPDAVALDVLREDSSMGDPQAAITLVAALLDRHENAGNVQDLIEAAQWMDRGWAEGHYQQSGLASRLFERHCDTEAISGHWLCDRGE